MVLQNRIFGEPAVKPGAFVSFIGIRWLQLLLTAAIAARSMDSGQTNDGDGQTRKTWAVHSNKFLLVDIGWLMLCYLPRTKSMEAAERVQIYFCCH